MSQPLRFDWQRIENPRNNAVPFIYGSQPTPSVVLNAWKVGNGAWRWMVLAVSADPSMVRWGSAGTLGRAKLAAENAIERLHIDPPQQPLWRAPSPQSDDAPF